MSYIEIFFLVILVASLIMGYRQGLVKQLGDIVGVVTGIVVCRLLGARAVEIGAKVMGSHADDAMGHYLVGYVGYIVLFLLVWLGVKILVRLLKLTTNALMLGPVDHAAGAVFMTGKCFLAVSILLNIWIFLFPESSLIQGSNQQMTILINHIVDFTPWLIGALVPIATGGA